MITKSVCNVARTFLWQRPQCVPVVPLLLRGVKRNFHYTPKKFLQTTNTTRGGDTARKSSNQRPWNEAASLMIVAPMNNSEPYSLGYLLVERSRTGRVMPGNWVHPGGNADPGDADPKWIDLFRDILNIDILQERMLREGAHVPEIYAAGDEDVIPKQVSLRITAIREAFEEAGILLCRPRNIDPNKHLHNGLPHYEFEELEDKKQVQSWQKRVRKNSQEFIQLCRELDCVPDIRAVHDWNNWLTPTIMKPKSRFDTMFYMIILPKLARVVIDGNEAVAAQWVSPEKAMTEHAKGDLRLMPPQIYEFSRLRHVKTIHDLQQRIDFRKELGIERYFPVIKNVVEGTLFLLPGDDLYPDPPNFLQLDPQSLEEIPQTFAQLKESSENLHRGIANSDGAITNYEINVTRFGHVY